MTDDLRQSSGSSATTSTVATTGTGTVDSASLMCGCPQPGPETIQVEQVLGANMEQQVVEFDMFVPENKPDISQVIDVYVKDVDIDTVDIIPDKVIIRGSLEVKVMYVADLPNHPVHAFEKRHVRFTQGIEIDGAQPDMTANADVTVEYVDYDFHRHHNRRKVHITIVLKFWARVLATTEMDVYALSVVDQLGQVESTTAATSGNIASAGTLGGGVSATQTGGGEIAGVSPQNVFVTSTGAGAENMTMPVTGTTTITGTNVNVRTGPGTNFPVVTKLNQGDTVTIQDQAFGWYKVLLADGKTAGWVASWLVSGTTGAKG